jgi:hypothetical protein
VSGVERVRIFGRHQRACFCHGSTVRSEMTPIAVTVAPTMKV